MSRVTRNTSREASHSPSVRVLLDILEQPWPERLVITTMMMRVILMMMMMMMMMMTMIMTMNVIMINNIIIIMTTIVTRILMMKMVAKTAKTMIPFPPTTSAHLRICALVFEPDESQIIEHGPALLLGVAGACLVLAVWGMCFSVWGSRCVFQCLRLLSPV